MSPRRARRARRIAHGIRTWRIAPRDIPIRLIADPVWREKHIIGPETRRTRRLIEQVWQ